MKKNEYVSPKMEIVMLPKVTLLAGSDLNGSGSKNPGDGGDLEGWD